MEMLLERKCDRDMKKSSKKNKTKHKKQNHTHTQKSDAAIMMFSNVLANAYAGPYQAVLKCHCLGSTYTDEASLFRTS